MKTMPENPWNVEDSAIRARDGIVTGPRFSGAPGRKQASATWVLVARNDEPVEDFFMDSPFGSDDHEQHARGEDPVAWICRGISSDGKVRLGAVDLEVDRFVSDVLSEDLDEQIHRSIRMSQG